MPGYCQMVLIHCGDQIQLSPLNIRADSVVANMPDLRCGRRQTRIADTENGIADTANHIVDTANHIADTAIRIVDTSIRIVDTAIRIAVPANRHCRYRKWHC